MKILKHKYTLVVFLTFLMLGCEKEYEDFSRITNFADFEVEGDAEIFHEVSTPYTDGTVTASEVGKDIPVEISVDGIITGYKGTTVNSDVSDMYVITYSAVNSDGFPGTTSRNVFVGPQGDMTTSIEGMYTSTVARGPDFVVGAAYTDMKVIFILKTGDDTYSLTDAMGGYYFIGRNYGFDYAAQGAVITANDIATNDFSITQAQFPVWGNTADITEFTVDAANKIITYTSTGNFTDGTFKVTLKQVQL